MHRVVVVLPVGAGLLEVSTALQVFALCPGRRYRARACGVMPGQRTQAFGIDMVLEEGLEALADADTVIIPGVLNVEEPAAPALIAALQDAHRRGVRIASICTGAFILAEAGLLDGRSATTHWYYADQLTARYPQIKVDPAVIYIDEGEILTSAGMMAGLDLCLYLVRRDHGERIANAVARAMVMAAHRSGDQAQFVNRPVPTPRAGSLETVRAWIRERLFEDISVPEMAAQAGLTPRAFARKFQAEMGESPMQWVIGERVRQAQFLLETTDRDIETVAREAGFGSALSLRQHFRQRLHVAPTDYRRTFRARRRAA